MKRNFAAAFLCLGLLAFESAAQAPAAPEREILALAKEIQAQQTLIAANQARIDARLVVIAEAVRLARIYSSRAGQKQ